MQKVYLQITKVKTAQLGILNEFFQVIKIVQAATIQVAVFAARIKTPPRCKTL